MKTIIATTIALTIATSAVATTSTSTLKWGGSTTNNIYPASCLFGNGALLKAGTMTYNPNTQTWTTTSDATVTISARKASEIKVEANAVLKNLSDSNKNLNVTVNYNDDWVEVTGAGADAVKNTATASPTNTASVHSFPTSGSAYTNVKVKLGGTAKLNGGNVAENTYYQLHHNVTCTY